MAATELPTSSQFNCRICDAVDLERIGLNQDFGLPVLKCANCGLRQTYPINDEFLDQYYEKSYSADHGRSDNPTYVEFSAKRGKVQKDFVQRVIGDRRFERILDIGAGAGGALEAYLDETTELACWDPDPHMRKVLANQSHISIIPPNELFGGQFDQHFDLVILSHVLEHLNAPRATLHQMRQVLADDGVAFIEVPAESEFARIHVSETLRTGLGHLLFFDVGTLRALVEKDDLFEVVSIEQYGVAIEDFYGRGVALTFDDMKPNDDGVWIRCVVRALAPETGKSAAPETSVSGTPIGYAAAVYDLNQKRNTLIAQLRKLYGTIRGLVGDAGLKLPQEEKAIPFAANPTSDLEKAATLLERKIGTLDALNQHLQLAYDQQTGTIKNLELNLHLSEVANDAKALLQARLEDTQNALSELKHTYAQAKDKISELEKEIERLTQR